MQREDNHVILENTFSPEFSAFCRVSPSQRSSLAGSVELRRSHLQKIDKQMVYDLCTSAKRFHEENAQMEIFSEWGLTSSHYCNS